MAVVDRQESSKINPQIIASSTMGAGESYPVRFTVPAGVDLTKYQINWTSTSGTIQPSGTSRDIVFTPTVAPDLKIALITLVLTDACGRQYFTTFNVNVNQCNFPAFTPQLIVPGVLEDSRIHNIAFTAPANIDLTKFKLKMDRIIRPDRGAGHPGRHKIPGPAFNSY